jgi:hypothetical protein
MVIDLPQTTASMPRPITRRIRCCVLVWFRFWVFETDQVITQRLANLNEKFEIGVILDSEFSMSLLALSFGLRRGLLLLVLGSC